MKITQLPVTETIEADDYLLFDDLTESKKLSIFDLLPRSIEMDRNASLKRRIFRGKNLGESFTSTHGQRIMDGTFEDMWLGDYWLINNVHWRIWDFNYWSGFGYNPEETLSSPHVVIMPDETFGTYRQMHNTDHEVITNDDENVQYGYYGSYLRTHYFSDIETRINQAFSTACYVSAIKEHFYNYKENDGDTVMASTLVEIPSRTMLFGNRVGCDFYNSGARSKQVKATPNRQLALAKLSTKFLVAANNSAYWLRDPVGPVGYAIVSADGELGYHFSREGSQPGYLRPAIRPIFALEGGGTV